MKDSPLITFGGEAYGGGGALSWKDCGRGRTSCARRPGCHNAGKRGSSSPICSFLPSSGRVHPVAGHHSPPLSASVAFLIIKKAPGTYH